MNKFHSTLSILRHHLVITGLLFLTACTAIKPIELFDKRANKSQGIAHLLVPVALDVTYFDGSKHSFIPAYQEIIPYSILPGDHIVGLMYQNMVENEDGDLEAIKSKTVVIRFTAKAGESYRVNFDNPATFAEAEELEIEFSATMSNQNQIIATSVSAIESPINDWVNGNSERKSAKIFNDVAFQPSRGLDNNASVNDHLIFWWKKASNAEKDQFQTWVSNE